MRYLVNGREAADLRMGVYTQDQIDDADYMEQEYKAVKEEIKRRGWEVVRAPYDAIIIIDNVKKIAKFISCFTNAEKKKN
ncbi:hypothetical protein [Kluyvera ascorbata]|uniref:hypothetical protein n=1 Tax=Kluyvera ascorbata TaxID=51288 RepID=UPI0039F73D61